MLHNDCHYGEMWSQKYDETDWLKNSLQVVAHKCYENLSERVLDKLRGRQNSIVFHVLY